MRTRKPLRNQSLYESVIGNIISLRRMHGKTQAQVAAGIGISRAQYTLIETGKSTLSIDQLISLAHFYRMAPGILFT